MMSKHSSRSVKALLWAAVATTALGTGQARAATLYWDSDAAGTGNSVTTGAGLGGSGSWNNSTSGTPLLNWWPGTGTTDQNWVNASNNTAVFWGPTAGTVALTDAVALGGLQFNTTAYTISTGSNALTFAPNTTITLNNAATNTAAITGAVTGTGAVTITTSTNASSTLTLNGTSTGGWSGATTISNGATLALADTNQALLNTSSIALGGSITLSNIAAQATLNRISDTAAITSTGGVFTYANTATTATNYAETIGAVSLSSGALNFVLSNNQNASTNSQTLTLSGLSQASTSTVAFSATGGLNATTNKIKVTGAAQTTAGQIIGPWATVGTASNAQTDYAVYDASSNVVAANIAASAETAWTTSTNAYTLSGPTTLTATRTIAALRYTGAGDTLSLGTSNFNLQTNGILNGGTGLLTIANGALGTGVVEQNGTAAGNLYVNTGNNNITISAPIVNNTGALTLVKTGTGTLTLSGSNTYTGSTIVQEGLLTTTSTTPIITNGLVVGSPGGGPAASFTFGNYSTVALAVACPITVYSNGSVDLSNSSQNLSGTMTIVGGSVHIGQVYFVGATLNMTGGTLSGYFYNGGGGGLANVITNACAATALISAANGGYSTTYNVARGTAAIDLNVTGVINSASGITKTGPGIMALGAANAHTNATTVNAGTLLLQNQYAVQYSPVTINAGSVVFDSSISGNAFTFGGLNGTGALSLQNNAATPAPVALTLYNNTATATSYSGNLSGSGSIVKTGTGTQTLSGTNSYAGTTTVNGGTLEFPKPASLYNSTTTSWTPSNIIVGSGGTLVIAVGSGGTTDFGSTASQANVTALLGNLASSTASTGLENGAAIGFDTTNASFATSTALTNLNSNANVIGLLKLGANTLTLSGVNTYSGPTTVTAGTLNFATQASLYNSTTASWVPANITVASGATLAVGVGAAPTYFDSTALDALLDSGHLGGSTTTGLTNGASLGFDTTNAAGGAFTYNSVIGNLNSGANVLGVTKIGAGTLTLGGVNTYTGVTTINAGVVSVGTIGNGGTPGNLGAATNVAANLVLNGGTLQYTGAAASTDRNFTLAAGTNSTIDVTNSLTFTGGSTATTGALTKVGAGTLILAGPTTYTGGTTVSGGTLQVGNLSTIAVPGAYVLQNNSNLVLSANNTYYFPATCAISGAGNVGFIGQTPNFYSTNLSPVFSYTGNTTINLTGTSGAGVLYIEGTGGLPATTVVDLEGGAMDLRKSQTIGGLWGTASASTSIGDDSGANTLTLNVASGTYTYSGTIAGTQTLTLVKSGSGTQVLAGANTYAGTTTISAGAMDFATQASLYNSTAASWVPANITVASGGILAVGVGTAPTYFDSTTVDLLLNSSHLGASTATTGLKSGASIGLDTTNAPGGAFTYNSVIGNLNSGANALGLAKLGTGTLTIGGANTYTGPTTISGGTLQAGVATVAGVSSAVGVNSDVTMGNVAGATLDTNGYNLQIGSLTGGGASGGNILLGSTTLTVAGTTIPAAAYAGIISSTGSPTTSLIKIGTGTLGLNGSNTYTGGTTVSSSQPTPANILQTSITGGTSGLPSTPFGTGTVTLTNATLGFGTAGTLASGTSLYVAGSLVLSGQSTIKTNVGSGTSVTYAPTSVTQNAGSQLLLAPSAAANLGTTEIVTLPNAPTVTNGTVALTYVDSANRFFLTYGASGKTGFSDAVATKSVTTTWTTATGSTASDIVDISTGTTNTVQNTVSAYAVRATATGTNSNFTLVAAGATLNIGAGGLILSNTSGSNNGWGGGSGGTINFGTNPGYISALSGNANVALGTSVAGTNGLTVYGNQVLYFGTANSFTGGLTIGGAGAAVYASGAVFNTVTPNPLTILSGSSFNWGNNNGSATFASLSGSGLLANTGYAGTASFTLNGVDGTGTSTFSGSINSTSSSYVLNLTKSGSTTQVINGATTFYGTTTVNGGTLTLQGAATLGTGSAGSLTIATGGTVNLDNSLGNADRVNNGAAVTLGGGLNLIGSPSANSSETVGALTPAAGAVNITLTPGTGYSASLTFASLGTRPLGNTALYRGTGLSSALGPNTSEILITASLGTPTASGTWAALDLGVGGLNTTTAPVLHGALADTSATGGGIGFATYDPTYGVRVLNSSEQVTSYPGSNANTNVKLNLTSTPVPITGVQTNTLQLNNVGSAVVVNNTGAALNAQNGLLFTGTGAISLNGGTFTQLAATSDLVVLSTNSGGVTIGTILANASTGASPATAGVTIGGSGAIRLNGAIQLAASGTNSSGTENFYVNNTGTTTLASTVSGGGSSSTNLTTLTTYVNAGTLKLTTGGSLGSLASSDGQGYHGVDVMVAVASGATFDLNGINSSLSCVNGSDGGGTITNSNGSTASTLSIVGQGNGQYQYSYYDISGNSATRIAGNLSVVINSTNAYSAVIQTLSGDNSYTGNTTMNLHLGTSHNGHYDALNINSPTALGNGTFIITGGNFANTSGFDLTMTKNNAQTWNGNFEFDYVGGSTGGNSLNLGTGAVTLGTTPTVTIGANTLTVGGNIGDGGNARGLTKAGAGTLALGGIDTFTGLTTVSAGTLNVLSGATLSAGATTVSASGGATLTVASGGTMSPGALTVTNTNTAAGNSVNVTFNSAQTVGSLSGSNATQSSGTNVDQINLNGAALTVNQTASLTFAGTLAGTGSLVMGSGSNSILTLSAANSYSGGTTLNAGELSISSLSNLGTGGVTFSGGTLQVTGTTVTSIDSRTVNWSTFNGGFDINSSSNTFTSGQAIGGTGSLAKSGPGTLTLSGASTYSGATNVTGGTLKAGVASVANTSGAFGLNSAVTMANTANVTLDITGYNTQIGSLTGGGATGGNVTLGSNTLSIGGDNTSPAAYAGAISGSGGITKIGSGTLTLTGASSYTGGTTIGVGTLAAGTLAISADANLGGANSTLTINNGTLKVASGYTSSLAITLGAATSTIEVDSGTLALSNALGGTGSLTKTGNGLLAVANLPSAISVNAGTLKLAHNDIANNALVTLSSLAFSGSGSLDLTNHDLFISGGAANLATYLGKITTSTVPAPTSGISANAVIALVSGTDYNTVTGTTSHDAASLYGKFTYAGDANLDGVITTDDYVALDMGFLFGLSGFVNGDFMQSGQAVNSATLDPNTGIRYTIEDFAAIDKSFQYQSGPLADGEIALHEQWFGAAYTDAFNALSAPITVPEPASLALLGLGAMSLLRRRR